jgi:DNA-binding CsgD family transcriptional regulator
MVESSQSLPPSLTKREQEILTLIAAGFGSKQIADRLKISGSTVANHRKNMLIKTGAKSSSELVYLILKYNTPTNYTNYNYKTGMVFAII